LGESSDKQRLELFCRTILFNNIFRLKYILRKNAFCD
jgi:hypothetical protein